MFVGVSLRFLGFVFGSLWGAQVQPQFPYVPGFDLVDFEFEVWVERFKELCQGLVFDSRQHFNLLTLEMYAGEA